MMMMMINDDDGDDVDDEDDEDDGHGGDYDGNGISSFLVNLRQYLCWCLQLIKLR